MPSKIFVRGVVQGVGFRPTVYRVANALNLRGYVLNKGSNVEICIDGDPEVFLKRLKRELPKLARIEEVVVEEAPAVEFDSGDFKILHSEDGVRTSLIPVDTAVCDDCIKELFDRSNRRYLYPFINCTACGARFSLIEDLPYDRERTAMRPFKMCEDCFREYSDPTNRRFHAQTISCWKCGPRFKLYDRSKMVVEEKEPIKEFARLIDEGNVGVVKGWGGMHVVCKLSPPLIKRLRQDYRRKAKPFAVMFRDLRTARTYAEISEFEEVLLRSPQRPIVLLRKLEDVSPEVKEVFELVSPGLGNIGVYVPYSAFQHVLFRYLDADGIIMTSANLPGEPMVIENADAFTLPADFYLLHDRRIVSRTDDSVVRCYDARKFFLRRSRGFVPLSLDIPYKEAVLSLGAERDVTFCISTSGKLFSSQFVGNSRHYGVIEFLRSGVERFRQMLRIERISAVAIDLHPRYATRRVGQELAEEFNAELVEIQHHWAHAASLMLDNGMLNTNGNDGGNARIVALTLDGTGYGSDGNAWGGELLVASFCDFGRVAHLQELPLPGGDAAIKDPRRFVFAIAERLKLGEEAGNALNLSEREQEILKKLMRAAPLTSSFGRVLDALSCYFGVCRRMTYEGEPAMKLEKYLDAGLRRALKNNGTPKHEFKTSSKLKDGGAREVLTLELFEQLFEVAPPHIAASLSDAEKAALAYSFVYALLEELVVIALEFAERDGLNIGLTGGVSYNEPITKIAESLVRRRDCGGADGDAKVRLLTHNEIPNGDGGISYGQNVIAGCKLFRDMA